MNGLIITVCVHRPRVFAPGASTSAWPIPRVLQSDPFEQSLDAHLPGRLVRIVNQGDIVARLPGIGG